MGVVIDAALTLASIPLALVGLAAALSVICLAIAAAPEPGPSIASLIESARGASGWALVARAQRAVHEAMPDYGLCNGFDTPRLALSRRRGICWQRALVLAEVLRAHGVEHRLVHAFRNRFEDGLVLGHVWLVVRVDGDERWVCPDHAENTPGVYRFTPLTRVRAFGPIMIALSWAGSPIANLFVAARRLARGERVAALAPRATLRARLLRSGLWPLALLLGWNAALAPALPLALGDDHAVPAPVLAAEAAGRLFVFGLAPFLELGASSVWERRGLALFTLAGIAYLASWAPPLLDPTPSWLWLLPYALPALWLLGLGLAARSGAYLAGAGIFALAHLTHGLASIGAATSAP